MAHHKSAFKRMQTNARDNERNRAYKTTLKTQVKKVRSANSKEDGVALFRKVESMLDKLARKGIIHRNKAANQKAKLEVLINRLK